MTGQSFEKKPLLWSDTYEGGNDPGHERCVLGSSPAPGTRRKSRLTRRNVLIGGLVGGAALFGAEGFWFVKHELPRLPRKVQPLLEIPLDPVYTISSFSLAWSPDGASIACSAALGGKPLSQGVIVVNLKSAKKTWTHWEASASIDALAWSPNGMRLAVTGHSPSDFTRPRPAFVQLWNVADGQKIAEFSVSNNTTYRSNGSTYKSDGSTYSSQLAWSPDGTRLAVSYDAIFSNNIMGHLELQVVQVWDWKAAQMLYTFPFSLFWMETDPQRVPVEPMMSWFPDGRTLAVSGSEKGLDLWDTRTGASLFHQESKPSLGSTSRDVISPDGKRAALAILTQGQSIILVWDLHSGHTLVRCQSVQGQLEDPVWSPDGKYLAALGYSYPLSLWMWDAHSGELLLTYAMQHGPGNLTWSPDGRLLALIDRLSPGFLHAPPGNPVLRVFPVEP